MFFSINPYAHMDLLEEELLRLIHKNPFVYQLWETIGNEIHYRLVEYPDSFETEYSSSFPVKALYLWGIENGGLDHEWLALEDGSFLNDDGKLISKDINPALSPIEQLASYGLWGIVVNYNSCGEIPEEGTNSQGWSRDDVISHKAECMLMAYEALTYSNKILRGEEPSPEERKKANQINFSALGKAGADKRHEQMRQLRQHAIGLYKSDSWPSANQAAYELKDEIITHGKTIGTHLSPQNAQRTIADWFRKCV